MLMGDNSGKAVLSYVHRFERLEEEMNETKEAKKDLAAEVKGSGYDMKAMTTILKERRDIRNKGLDKIREEKYMEDIYKKALVDAGEPMGYENEFGGDDV